MKANKPDRSIAVLILVLLAFIVICAVECPIERKADAQEKAKINKWDKAIEKAREQVKKPPLKMITATKDCLIYHIPVLSVGLPKRKMPKCIAEFIYEWKEYAAECYPDSVRTTFDNGVWVFERLDPTFTGFMQFLTLKYEAEK